MLRTRRASRFGTKDISAHCNFVHTLLSGSQKSIDVKGGQMEFFTLLLFFFFLCATSPVSAAVVHFTR